MHCKDCLYYEACPLGLAIKGSTGTCLKFKNKADFVEVSKVAEMLQDMFGDDCACNYNGIDEWLPEKCKYAETDCPEPKEKLGCWKEFVKQFVEQERGGEK